MPISRARNSVSLIWLGLGLFFVLTAFFLALPFGTIETVASIYLALLGISMLATGSIIRWGSRRRWQRFLAVWAALGAAALSVAQFIRNWAQPLNAANLVLLVTSIAVIFAGWLCTVYFAHPKNQAAQTAQPTPTQKVSH